jgi:hypothetical protein
MMIDRRTFIVGTSLAAITPGPRALPLNVAAMASDDLQPVLMIDGWSRRDDSPADNQVWMRIGYGWRTAWH